jgi:hypothetical protein
MEVDISMRGRACQRCGGRWQEWYIEMHPEKFILLCQEYFNVKAILEMKREVILACPKCPEEV